MSILGPSSLSTRNISTTAPHSFPEATLQFQKQMDWNYGVTHYYKNGTRIAFEDYWAQKEFESQPFFILGENLRNGFDYIIKHVSDITSTTWNAFTNLFSSENNNKKLTETYQTLENEIKLAKENALGAKKPLMVLVGESHFSKLSANLEKMILQISFENLNINSVFTESFHKKDYILQKKEQLVLSSLPMIVIEDFTLASGRKKIPIDYVACFGNEFPTASCDDMAKHFPCDPLLILLHQHRYAHHLYSISDEGMKFRNTAMAHLAIQLNPEKLDVVTVVGCAHLRGMVQDTSLSDAYIVLPINAAFYQPSPGDVNYDFLYSHEVVKFPLPTEKEMPENPISIFVEKILKPYGDISMLSLIDMAVEKFVFQLEPILPEIFKNTLEPHRSITNYYEYSRQKAITNRANTNNNEMSQDRDGGHPTLNS